MGTSSAFSGPSGGTPLVPSWIESDTVDIAPAVSPTPSPSGDPAGEAQTLVPPQPPTNQPEIEVLPDSNRFRVGRCNFTRFAHSGGSDRASLGRAVSNYVSTSTGGARHAMQRMGASRNSSKRLLSFLTNVQTNGSHAALRSLNLETLAGRSIDEIFLGLADYVCPNTGSIDDGIAREAFIETIVDLAELGFTDLDALTPDQLQTVFELYATHAIVARLCNDIGTKIIVAPINAQVAQNIQKQLFDFIRNGVSDALTKARSENSILTLDRVNAFVDSVYESAFKIINALGETEANQ